MVWSADADGRFPVPFEEDEENPSASRLQLKKLWETSIHWDVEVVSLKRSYKCHKAILDQSLFFAAAVKSDRFLEGHLSRVELPDDDPDAVHAMMQWCYLGRYDAEPMIVEVDTDKYQRYFATSYVKIYALAVKYDLPQLKANAAHRMIDEIYIENMLIPQELHYCGASTEFLKAVELLYESVPPSDRDLKDAILKHSKYWLRFLVVETLKNWESYSGTEIQLTNEAPERNRLQLLKMPEFMVDMIAAAAEQKAIESSKVKRPNVALWTLTPTEQKLLEVSW